MGVTLLWLTGVAYATDFSVIYYQQGNQQVVPGRQLSEGVYEYNSQEFSPDSKKNVTLSTLEWPPYIGATICQQGWVMQATVAMLASRGYRIKVQFRPWMRAVLEAETGQSDILFPEYFIEPEAPSDIHPGTSRLEHLALSSPIPGGPVALLKRRSDPFEFDGEVTSLIGKKLGVVRGYQNTPELDALIDKKALTTLEVKDDLQNAQILYGNRVELIVGDPSVIFYSVKAAALDAGMKQDMLSQLQVVEPALKNNYLYYAISRRSRIREALLADINAAIKDFSLSGELAALIERTHESCGTQGWSMPLPLKIQ